MNQVSESRHHCIRLAWLIFGPPIPNCSQSPSSALVNHSEFNCTSQSSQVPSPLHESLFLQLSGMITLLPAPLSGFLCFSSHAVQRSFISILFTSLFSSSFHLYDTLYLPMSILKTYSLLITNRHKNLQKRLEMTCWQSPCWQLVETEQWENAAYNQLMSLFCSHFLEGNRWLEMRYPANINSHSCKWGYALWVCQFHR